MTQEALQGILTQIATDPAFAQQVAADPTGTLAGFQLTPDELTAAQTKAKGMSTAPLDQPDAKGMS